jgi:hypothetical protein
MFDPDYRKEYWNKSRFAPKNLGGKRGKKGNGITTTAAAIPVMLFLLGIWAAPNSLYTIGTVCLILWVVLGIWIRKSEWNRLQKLYGQPQPQVAYPSNSYSKQSEKTTIPANIAPTLLPPSLQKIDHSLIDPTLFEEEVAWIISSITKHRTEVVGGSGDGGVDIKVYHRDTNNLVGIVQCKRYSPKKPIPPNIIRELFAVKTKMRVKTAYLATTSYFTEATKREAQQFGIRLLDGDKIRELHRQLVGRLHIVADDEAIKSERRTGKR